MTICVPDDVAATAQRAVDDGDIPNVSAYFTRLAQPGQKEPDWVAAREIVAEMAEEIGGVSEADMAWAEESLGIRDRSRGRLSSNDQSLDISSGQS